MMMKFCMLVIVSMIMLGLVAGVVSGDAMERPTTDKEGFTGGDIGQTPGQPSPEFSTFGIAAVGALGALSYFYIRRKRK